MINTTSKRLKARNFFICRYLSFYGQLKFNALLNSAWNKFYDLGAWLLCFSSVIAVILLSVFCISASWCRGSCLLCKRPEVFMIPWTDQKLNVLLIFIFHYKRLSKIKILFKIQDKTFFILICNRIYGFCWSVTRKGGTANVNTDSQWGKQEACFARTAQVWLSFNLNTRVTSGVWMRRSNRIARASELGSCHSNLCHFWGYERLQKISRFNKTCFENVNIRLQIHVIDSLSCEISVIGSCVVVKRLQGFEYVYSLKVC